MKAKHITDLLKEKGYKEFRWVYKSGEFKLIDYNLKGFSSMTIGGLDIRYCKSKETKPEEHIIYGLNEANKPPTLIYPRPNIMLKKNGKFICVSVFDDWMNKCLQRESSEDIFESMFDNDKIFVYES